MLRPGERESIEDILQLRLHNPAWRWLIDSAHVHSQVRLHLGLLFHVEQLCGEFMDLCSVCCLLRKLLFSIEVFGYLAARLLDVGVLVSYSDNPELTALLAVHVDVLLVGLVPRVVAVSLVHHEAFDVPRSSHASWRQKTALGRCWIDIEL